MVHSSFVLCSSLLFLRPRQQADGQASTSHPGRARQQAAAAAFLWAQFGRMRHGAQFGKMHYGAQSGKMRHDRETRTTSNYNTHERQVCQEENRKNVSGPCVVSRGPVHLKPAGGGASGRSTMLLSPILEERQCRANWQAFMSPISMGLLGLPSQ